jgi:hypothetical protein
VLWEARIIRQLLYDSGSVSDKFIPVLFFDGSADHIPTPVRGAARHVVDTDAGYEGLCPQVTKQPGVIKPPLGKRKALPPKQPKPEAAAAARSAEQAAVSLSAPHPTPIPDFDCLAEASRCRTSPWTVGFEFDQTSLSPLQGTNFT